MMKRILNILVVEDSPDLRKIAQVRLSLAGHRVTCVENGAEAIKTCIDQEQAFDIILMDLRMPVMDGNEAIKRLRQNPNTQAIPILVVSGEGDGAQEAIESDGETFLSKPYNKRQMFDSILDVLIKSGSVTATDTIA